jgi:hypothetical protein
MSGSQMMIVLIVLIVTVAGIYRSKHGLDRNSWRDLRKMRKNGIMPDGTPLTASTLPSPREEELLREVSDLRERIKVLERIATDGRSSAALANEIESLRGPQD